jgi:hypothetical protein
MSVFVLDGKTTPAVLSHIYERGMTKMEIHFDGFIYFLIYY